MNDSSIHQLHPRFGHRLLEVKSLLISAVGNRARITEGSSTPFIDRPVMRPTSVTDISANLEPSPQPTTSLTSHVTCLLLPADATKVMGALDAAGYRTSSMHREPLALKTDAPDAAVWDVLLCWARDNPQSPPVRPAGRAILDRGPQLIAYADFAAAQKAGAEIRAKDAAGSKGRFLHMHNPEGRWGPLSKWSVMADAVPGVEEEGDLDSTAVLPQ